MKYIHSLIAQIPFRAYISTGYDTFIEDEYQAIKTPSKLTKYYRSSINEAIEAYRRKECFILKLHGDTENPDPIILSKRASVISYPSELREILSASTTLLIGFEKEDSDLEDIKRLIGDNELRKCWMVVPKGHLSSNEMKQLQEYDKITTIEYVGLVELKRLFITIEKLSSGLRTTEIYISYALEDEKMKVKLMDQLKIMAFPELEPIWLDGEIGAGEEMEEEILKRLQKAEIILVLISAKYLTSLKDNHLIELEMTNAVKRHTKGEARVIPVILRPCAWEDTPFFAKLQVLPKSKKDKSIKPINNWSNRDQVYYEVALDIKKAIENWAKTH